MVNCTHGPMSRYKPGTRVISPTTSSFTETPTLNSSIFCAQVTLKWLPERCQYHPQSKVLPGSPLQSHLTISCETFFSLPCISSFFLSIKLYSTIMVCQSPVNPISSNPSKTSSSNFKLLSLNDSSVKSSEPCKLTNNKSSN